jgi:protein transport protein SEC31
MQGADDAFMSRTTKHTGAIKSLQFNPLKPQILATAGAKGELYIYDVNDIANPFRLGTAAARSDDLECVAWNRKVPHILATGGSGGFVTIWDLKTKKASLTLNNARKAVGAIAWDPNNPTKLLTATPDDSNPAIMLWDLRNSNAPERILQGHDQGILSISWCQQDSDLLLSCGKDNRTICWNPQTGEKLGEFPEATNWTFQIRFNPHNPSLSATASFDGKIVVQTLQNTNALPDQTALQGPADGEDFFAKAQMQPQGASFSLKKAPKWLERPVGASFGFGGKLVSFRLQAVGPGQARSSGLQISKFSVDSGVGSASQSFEDALKAGEIKTICENHIAKAETEEEREDWKVIETLLAGNPRQGVTDYLGFSGDNVTNGLADTDEEGKNSQANGDTKTSDTAKSQEASAKSNRLSTFFADGAEQDDFLSGLSATKDAKTDNPFQLLSAEDSAADRQITTALMLGKFENAMKICLAEGRIADAFMIAHCGGKELVEKVQSTYLSGATKGPNYLRLLASVIGKNMWDVVYNADLANWKETMATLCTYADPTEFPDLCEALGDRVLESGSRKDASFCYVVGSKLEKVIGIWISELQENEEAAIQGHSGDSTFAVHARSLQNFIEKVTVFREVTKFQDNEKELTEGWKLGPLYEKYIEYADVVAAHGHLAAAEKYLSLLPALYPLAEVARNRVRLATKSVETRSNVQQQPSTTRSAPRPQPAVGYLPQQPPVSAQTPTIGNPYGPPSSIQKTPYAPSTTSAYAPPSAYLPPQPQSGYGAPPMAAPIGYTQGGPPNPFAAPPRNPTPLVAPPSQAKDMTNWNDTPMVTKPSISRRGTPGMLPAPLTSPFPNQPGLVLPPSAPPFGGPPRGSPTPPPPPPKGPAPARMSSPLSATGAPPAAQNMRQPPPSNNMYAPPPALEQSGSAYSQQAAPSLIPRGPSPYNAPPAGPPPNNRYAPAPALQQSAIPPQPMSRVAPPPSAYVPQQAPPTSHPPHALPSQPNFQPQQGIPQLPQSQPTGPPPQGPPAGSRPGTAQSQEPKAPAAAPKYPPGDRSHIPTNAQQLVTILSGDMQRVAGKAPPSFAAQVKDTQKRLNILFDHLNNGDLVKPDTIERLNELAQALQARDYDAAARMQVDVQREKMDECGNWMVSLM